MAKLIHITLGHKGKGGDSSPAVLYSGDNRAAALAALRTDGYVMTEYGCFNGYKRRVAVSATPAAPVAKAVDPTPTADAPETAPESAEESATTTEPTATPVTTPAKRGRKPKSAATKNAE